MENYIVSARKYRPSTFSTVVGQQAITQTLQNAITNDHLAQAFLFCGPRGVGKTTTARILAKTINAASMAAEATAEEDFSFNIFELDAASNNSVDDIRSLIDQVRIAPQVGKYKVYIIDEVHMLSQAAFNAFLKTLEEPPPHAIFILATTEKHKIIPTILSRCQIFDFQRIGVGDMVQHLTGIAEKEGIQAEKEALHVVAQKADGALRDALSIFDQMVSFSGKTLTYQDVIRNLNVLDYDYYFKVTEAMLGNNIPQSLLLLDEILHKGFDGHHFVTGLAAHFRDLLVCQDASTLKLLEVAESIQARYREQATTCAPEWLLKGLGIISRADVQYKASKNQRLLVELALMQLASLGRSAEKKTEAGSIAPPPKIIDNQLVKQKIAAVSQETPPAQPMPTPPASPAPKPAATPASVSAAATPAAPAAPAPRPAKTPATMARLRTNMVSINDQLHPASKQEEEADAVVAEEQASYANKPQDRFTEEDLMAHWKSYCAKIQQQGMGPLYGVLSKRPPKLGKNFEVLLTLDNSVEESILINDKADLQAHLREQLNNYALHIEYTITKQKEDKKPYTDRERFERLAERNPSLMKLKQKLDLEI